MKTAAGGTISAASVDGRPTGEGVVTSAVNGYTTIEIGATVTGATDGVSATATGTGEITITSTAAITGGTGAGVKASAQGGAIDIGGTNGLSGAVEGTTGISAINTGSGTINVKTATNGTVTGTTAEGVKTTAATGATTIALGAAVSGATIGVSATATGAGAITVTSDAAITGGSGIGGVGVYAGSKGGAIEIGGTTGLSGAVTGALGISATTESGGTISVKTKTGGTVTGSRDEGIKTSAVNGATTIDVGDAVSGVTIGVYATSTTGQITVTGAGDVKGTGIHGSGIWATSNSGAITIGGSGKTDATGDGDAINAQVTGTGAVDAITITRSGDVTAISGKGIYASNAGSGAIKLEGIGKVTSTSAEAIYLLGNGNIDVGTSTTALNGAISGRTGIKAETSGSGNISIVSTTGGTVTGTTDEGIKTTAAGGTTTIDVGAAVKGATVGISATSTTGQITVTGAGDVSGTGTNAAGILATTTSGAITISGEGKTEAKGTANAIDAQITGTGTNGTITISRSGEVTADQGRGIYAQNVGTGGSGTGTGNITLNGIGKVTSNGAEAIRLISNGNIAVGQTTALSGAISGTTGISAETTGSSTIAITTGTGGTVTGTSAEGIKTTAATGATTIAVGDVVRGATDAINATATGAGDITITSTGRVASEYLDADSYRKGTGRGIFAQSEGGKIQIGKADAKISGPVQGTIGIVATTNVDGTIAITTGSGGTVTGTTAEGVKTTAATGATTIALGAAVSGATKGVSATASGAGAITVTSSSTITGGTSTGHAGVSATSQGGDVKVGDTAGLSGAVSGRQGIVASTTSGGKVDIKTTTGGTVTGSGAEGIKTSAVDGLTTIDIRANVSGSTYALDATSKGSGNIDVTLRSGSLLNGVTGGAAKFTLEGAGNATFANYSTVNDNVTAVTTGSGLATLNNYGTVSLNSPKSITGFDAVNNKDKGVLTGTGSFGKVIAESGSFIRPGDLSVAADNSVREKRDMRMTSLTMQSGSTLEIRANGSGDNVNDKLVVEGTASLLSGAKLFVLATPNDEPSWKTDRSYRVLEAKKVDGKFDAKDVTTDLAFLDPVAVYGSVSGSDYVDLTFKRNAITFQSVAETPTEIAVAINIQRWQDSPDLSSLGQEIISAFGSLSAKDAKIAYNNTSGSGVSGAAATVTGQFYGFTAQVVTEARTSPLTGLTAAGPTAFSGSDMPLAYAAPETTAALGNPFGNLAKTGPAATLSPNQTWRIWSSVFGASHTVDAKASRGSPGVTWHDWSGAAGFEMAVSPGIVAGVAIGGSNSPFSASKRATTGESTGGMASVYTFASLGDLYATASLGYGRFETKTVRTVDFPGQPVERQSVKYGTDSYDAFLELGWRITLGDIVAMPFVNAHPGILLHEAATETSETSGAKFGLRYFARDTKTLPASLGLQLGTSFAVGANWAVLAEGRAAWVHEFSPKRQVRASFIGLPAGSSFVADGVYATEDLARFTATVNVVNEGGFSIFGRAGADVSSSHRSYSGQAGVRWAW